MIIIRANEMRHVTMENYVAQGRTATEFLLIMLFFASVNTGNAVHQRNETQSKLNTDILNQNVTLVDLVKSLRSASFIDNEDVLLKDAAGSKIKVKNYNSTKVSALLVQGGVIYASVIVTEKKLFSSHLDNSSSSQYIQLSQAVERMIDSLFKTSFSSFLSAKVLQFRRGSIIADLKVEFKENVGHAKNRMKIREKREAPLPTVANNSTASNTVHAGQSASNYHRQTSNTRTPVREIPTSSSSEIPISITRSTFREMQSAETLAKAPADAKPGFASQTNKTSNAYKTSKMTSIPFKTPLIKLSTEYKTSKSNMISSKPVSPSSKILILTSLRSTSTHRFPVSGLYSGTNSISTLSGVQQTETLTTAPVYVKTDFVSEPNRTSTEYKTSKMTNKMQWAEMLTSSSVKDQSDSKNMTKMFTGYETRNGNVMSSSKRTNTKSHLTPSYDLLTNKSSLRMDNTVIKLPSSPTTTPYLTGLRSSSEMFETLSIILSPDMGSWAKNGSVITNGTLFTSDPTSTRNPSLTSLLSMSRKTTGMTASLSITSSSSSVSGNERSFTFSNSFPSHSNLTTSNELLQTVQYSSSLSSSTPYILVSTFTSQFLNNQFSQKPTPTPSFTQSNGVKYSSSSFLGIGELPHTPITTTEHFGSPTVTRNNFNSSRKQPRPSSHTSLLITSTILLQQMSNSTSLRRTSDQIVSTQTVSNYYERSSNFTSSEHELQQTTLKNQHSLLLSSSTPRILVSTFNSQSSNNQFFKIPTPTPSFTQSSKKSQLYTVLTSTLIYYGSSIRQSTIDMFTEYVSTFRTTSNTNLPPLGNSDTPQESIHSSSPYTFASSGSRHEFLPKSNTSLLNWTVTTPVISDTEERQTTISSTVYFDHSMLSNSMRTLPSTMVDTNATQQAIKNSIEQSKSSQFLEMTATMNTETSHPSNIRNLTVGYSSSVKHFSKPSKTSVNATTKITNKSAPIFTPDVTSNPQMPTTSSSSLNFTTTMSLKDISTTEMTYLYSMQSVSINSSIVSTSYKASFATHQDNLYPQNYSHMFTTTTVTANTNSLNVTKNLQTFTANGVKYSSSSFSGIAVLSPTPITTTEHFVSPPITRKYINSSTKQPLPSSHISPLITSTVLWQQMSNTTSSIMTSDNTVNSTQTAYNYYQASPNVSSSEHTSTPSSFSNRANSSIVMDQGLNSTPTIASTIVQTMFALSTITLSTLNSSISPTTHMNPAQFSTWSHVYTSSSTSVPHVGVAHSSPLFSESSDQAVNKTLSFNLKSTTSSVNTSISPMVLTSAVSPNFSSLLSANQTYRLSIFTKGTTYSVSIIASAVTSNFLPSQGTINVSATVSGVINISSIAADVRNSSLHQYSTSNTDDWTSAGTFSPINSNKTRTTLVTTTGITSKMTVTPLSSILTDYTAIPFKRNVSTASVNEMLNQFSVNTSRNTTSTNLIHTRTSVAMNSTVILSTMNVPSTNTRLLSKKSSGNTVSMNSTLLPTLPVLSSQVSTSMIIQDSSMVRVILQSSTENYTSHISPNANDSSLYGNGTHLFTTTRDVFYNSNISKSSNIFVPKYSTLIQMSTVFKRTTVSSVEMALHHTATPIQKMSNISSHTYQIGTLSSTPFLRLKSSSIATALDRSSSTLDLIVTTQEDTKSLSITSTDSLVSDQTIRFSFRTNATTFAEEFSSQVITAEMNKTLVVSPSLTTSLQPTPVSSITSDTTTISAPIASSKKRILSGNVTIVNRIYKSELSNSFSTEYIALAKQAKVALVEVFENTSGVVDVEIHGFRNGSVIILFRIIMESFSNVTTQELAIMISMPRTVHTLLLSSMSVEELCTRGFCSNHGTCTKLSRILLQCRCMSGYTGPRCSAIVTGTTSDDDDFEEYWIAIGVCLGFLVLIIILLIFLALRRRRKYYVTRESVMSVGRTSGDVFFNHAYGHSRDNLDDKSGNLIPLEVVYENSSSSFKKDTYEDSEFVSNKKSEEEEEEEDVYKTQLQLFLKQNNLLRNSNEDTPKPSWASSRSSVSTADSDSGLAMHAQRS